jgi:hypothetical protein
VTEKKVSFHVSKESLKDAAERLYERLRQEARHVFFTGNWPFDVLNEPGVYLIWNKQGELVYVGETSNLRARMADIKDTRNHTCRRKVGRLEFHDHPEYVELRDNKRKYPAAIEAAINAYFKDELKVAFAPVTFGRLELESYLIEQRQPGFSPKYNSKSNRRGRP